MIRSKVSGKVLDVCNESTKNGAAILEYAEHQGPNQQWLFIPEQDKHYFIESLNSGKVLEIEGGVNADGVRIIQNTKYGNTNQLWRIEKPS